MATLTNLLDFDPAQLVAYCAELGEKPFRAKQLQRWIHQFGVADFDDMTDLAKSLREKLKTRAEVTRAGHHQRPHVHRRHPQVAGRRRQRQCGRNRVHPGRKPRHAVHLHAGRLRRQLPLLLDRQAGLQPQPDRGRDHRPAVDGRVRTAPHQGHRGGPKGERQITNVVMMGMGEPLLNFEPTVTASS
jgi:23S rRNA (adenine2503-C2)-methyltransferase